MRYRVEIDRPIYYVKEDDILYRVRNGKSGDLPDEEHELILDNPEADACCAEQSIRWAIERGWSRELAEAMFRPKKRT